MSGSGNSKAAATVTSGQLQQQQYSAEDADTDTRTGQEGSVSGAGVSQCPGPGPGPGPSPASASGRPGTDRDRDRDRERTSSASSCCERILGSDSSNSYFSLKWNEFDKQLSSGFSNLFQTQDFADVTLSCEGKSALSHKVVLAMCSPYFRHIFKENPCKHPVVIIKGIKFRDLQHILKFIYFGQVSVVKNEIQDFIDAAQLLKLDGISSDSSTPEQSESEAAPNVKMGSSSSTTTSSSLGSSDVRSPHGSNTISSKDGSGGVKKTIIKQEFIPTQAQTTPKYPPTNEMGNQPTSTTGISSVTGSGTGTGIGGGMGLSPSRSNVKRTFDPLTPSAPTHHQPQNQHQHQHQHYSGSGPSDRDTHYAASSSSSSAGSTPTSVGGGASRQSKHVFSRISPNVESTAQHHPSHQTSAMSQSQSQSHVRKKAYGISWPTALGSVPPPTTLKKMGQAEDSSIQPESLDLSSTTRSSPRDPLNLYPARSMSCESGAPAPPAPASGSSSAVSRPGGRSSSCDNSTDSLVIDTHQSHQSQQQQQQLQLYHPPHHPDVIHLDDTTEESRDSLVTEDAGLGGEYELSIQTVETPYGHLKSFTTPSGMVVTSTLHGHSSLAHSSSGSGSGSGGHIGPSGWVVGMGQLLKPSTATSSGSMSDSNRGKIVGDGSSSLGGGYRSSPSSSSSSHLHFPNGPLAPKHSSLMEGGGSSIPAKKRFSHLSHSRLSLYNEMGYSADKGPQERHRHMVKLSGGAHHSYGHSHSHAHGQGHSHSHSQHAHSHSKSEPSVGGGSGSGGGPGGGSGENPLAGLMVEGAGGIGGASSSSGASLSGLSLLSVVPRLKNQRHSQVPQSARYTTAEVDAMVDSVTNHSGPFVPCKICDKLVKRERLRAHIHECHLVHGEKIICPHCGVGLKSKGSYRVHVWRHRRGVLTKGLKSAKRALVQRPRDP